MTTDFNELAAKVMLGLIAFVVVTMVIATGALVYATLQGCHV